MPCSPRDFTKKVIGYLSALFDFKYCVILVYRLEESDRTVCVQVTFGFHTK